MSNAFRFVLGVVIGTAFLTTVALGQNPTYSIEVTAVNSIPIDPPLSHITVAPGDVLTVTLFLRDWSPAGERLRAYQAQVDSQGYTSGDAGSIRPVDFDETSGKNEENKDNAFVDIHHPMYVHAGGGTLALVDSISPGYRWLSVLLNRDASPVCPAQDGTRYYCGTLRMKVSEDAQGLFTLSFVEHPIASVLQDPDSKIITPLGFEQLTIEVTREANAPRMVSSNPPSGAVDARQSPKANVTGRGLDTFDLGFNMDTAGLTPADFTIADGSIDPPQVKRLASNGSILTVVLDRGVRVGSWVTVSHKASNTHVRFGHLPGDVNGDGVLNVKDVLALIESSKTGQALPPYSADINCDGVADHSDVLRVIDLLAEPGAYRATLH